MWLLVLFLAFGGSSAALPPPPPPPPTRTLTTGSQTVITTPDRITYECLLYSEKEPSIDLAISKDCCHFDTKECHFTYNGMCRLWWDTADCDYTVDVCQNKLAEKGKKWYCTCCASCEGDAKTDCTDNKGVCRRSCHGDEYSAFWNKCSSDNCMCCKKRCPSATCASGTGICVHETDDCPKGYPISTTGLCKGIDCKCCQENACNGEPCASGQGMCMNSFTHCPPGYYASTDDHCKGNCQCCRENGCQDQPCALGTGRCVSDSQDCPQGYYASTEYFCKGFNCKCCQPCETDENCAKKKGFCEWRDRKCPPKYKDDDCSCPNKECRCCSPGSGLPIVIEQQQNMKIEIPQNP